MAIHGFGVSCPFGISHSSLDWIFSNRNCGNLLNPDVLELAGLGERLFVHLVDQVHKWLRASIRSDRFGASNPVRPIAR